MYRILIVEDDETIASLVRENLEKWGFEARCVTDFEHVDAEFTAYAPHLVLMDVSLPCFNGYYWCAELRKRSKAPILFLSSHSENMDVVMAVNMGGDDYVTKPFSVDVFVAKVNALLRRAYSYTDEVAALECRGALPRGDHEGALELRLLCRRQHADREHQPPARQARGRRAGRSDRHQKGRGVYGS